VLLVSGGKAKRSVVNLMLESRHLNAYSVKIFFLMLLFT
jgi:hypothetical protein